MTRTVSWLSRLPALARRVSESVRSHYTTADLQSLFEIQPRSAQMLVKLLPTVQIGKSILVEREALAGFLSRLEAADDPVAELAAVRAQGKPPAIRRKLRELLQEDIAAGESSPPANMILERGILTVRFGTVADLAAAMVWLTRIMDQYEPILESEQSEERILELEDAAYIRNFLQSRMR
jgi:hypothetical protein